MSKGFVSSLETILVGVGWMILLSALWQEGAAHKNIEWNLASQDALEKQVVAQSDALVLQHHPNPWLGCASFSNEKRRAIPHMLEKSCLEKLSEHPPPKGITYVSTAEGEERTTYFEASEKGKNCVGMRRMIIMRDNKHAVWLDVRACA